MRIKRNLFMTEVTEYRIQQIVDNGQIVQMTLAEDVLTEPVSQKQIIKKKKQIKKKKKKKPNQKKKKKVTNILQSPLRCQKADTNEWVGHRLAKNWKSILEKFPKVVFLSLE